MRDLNITGKFLGLFLFSVLLATMLEILGNDENGPGIIFIIVLVFIAGIEVLILGAFGLIHSFKWYTIRRAASKRPVINKFQRKQQEEQRELAQTYLMCAGLVLLVGGALCLGSPYLFA